MSRDEPQSALSDLAMLDGQLHLEGWGPVHVALTDDAIIWERDKRGKKGKEVGNSCNFEVWLFCLLVTSTL